MFLVDQRHIVEQVIRRCLDIQTTTDVHLKYLRPRYIDIIDPLELKHTLKVTVLDKRYHFSVRCHAGHGHAIASEVATMNCVRQRVSQKSPRRFEFQMGCRC
jgi:hypothetical protein